MGIVGLRYRFEEYTDYLLVILMINLILQFAIVATYRERQKAGGPRTTIRLTSGRTAGKIKRLKETVLTISPDYSDRPTPDFLALSVFDGWRIATVWRGSRRAAHGEIKTFDI